MSNKKYYYIYLTTNKINGKKYIGKRVANCPIHCDNYLGSGKILKQAIKKYGVNNFTKEILEVVANREELNIKEKEWIDKLNACDDPSFYNIASGGDGGNTFKGKTKEEMEEIGDKISKSNSGDNHWIKKKGYVFTETHKRNISINHADVSGDKNPRYNSTEVGCSFCGKSVYASKYKIKSRNNIFCSKQCCNSFRKILHSSNNPNRKSSVVVIYGVVYEKPSRKEMIAFINETFEGISCSRNWWSKGVPKKYSEVIELIQ